MPTEGEFTFINVVMIIFCLIYFLNIPRSNQNPLLLIPVKAQYQSLQNWHFDDISPYCCSDW